ncbi:O-antigen ligase family protein [Marinobacter sp. NFXS9]|uniref:O-antigen ligase family protein n=1 Tax=Marinobacter sp. NFXS9 TaxID=2818433 RepID=UPI0032DF4A1B
MNQVSPGIANRFWTTIAGTSLNGLRKTYLTVLAAYVFCFLPWFSTYRTAETLLVVLLVGILALGRNSSPLKRVILTDPIFRICLVLLAYLLLVQLWYHVSLPEYVDPSAKVTRHYLKPLMVLLVAAGVSMLRPARAWPVLLLALAGLYVYLGLEFRAAEWIRALKGYRVDFGIHNAEHTGMFFGTYLLCLLCLSPRLIRWSCHRGWLVSIAVFPLLLAALLLAIEGTLASQTRAVWLGLLQASLVAVILLIGRLLTSRDTQGEKRKLSLLLALVAGAFVVTISLTLNSSQTVEKRFSTTDIQIDKILEAPSENVDPKTSSGVRLYSWRVAMGWVGERPLLGWGAGSTKEMIQHSDYFGASFKQNFGHLHNTFMETLVAQGLIGTAILVALIVWIGIATVRAFRGGDLPWDVFVFAWCFLAFWIVINMFESYILYPTGQYLNAVIVGFVYSFHFRRRLEDAQPHV